MEVIADDRPLTPCRSLIELIKNCFQINFINVTGSGILFRLTTIISKSNYYDENNNPITQFIIKIVSLSEIQRFYDIIRSQKTSTEKASSFLKEAQVQQSVWKKCILEGRPVFSPSVLNLSLFKFGQADSFLKLLKSKTEQDNIILMNFIFITSSSRRDIGVILMPEIENAVNLLDVLFENKRTAYINTIVNILELYFFHGIIHLDLHGGNILVQQDNSSRSKLIDFGEIMKINQNSRAKKSKKEVLTVDSDEDEDVIKFTEQREEDLANFARIGMAAPDPIKIEFVEKICRSMSEYDAEHAGTELNAEGQLKFYKMKWIETIYHDEALKHTVFLNAFNELKRIEATKMPQALPPNTFNLDNGDPISYYCDEDIVICQPITPTTVIDDTSESKSICNIMGGIRSKKRIKLSKKKIRHILKSKKPKRKQRFSVKKRR